MNLITKIAVLAALLNGSVAMAILFQVMQWH